MVDLNINKEKNVQPGMPNAKTATRLDTSTRSVSRARRQQRANLAQVTPQDMDDTHIDECGYVQPNPPAINMLKVVNNTGTTSGTESLKFPIDVNPRGTYKHHLEVSIDTGADVNCMNEKTFKKLFPEVELSV